MILGLRTVIYPVADLATAKAWYAQVLGVAAYFDQPFYVGFDVGGFELGLVPDGVPGAAGATAYWGTADAQSEVERLVELGAQVETAVEEVGEGIRTAVLRDPDGNLFGVIENPHFDRAKLA